MPQVQKVIQKILPGIQSWGQVNKTTIDRCDQQLENILRKLDMEQNKVLLEEERTKSTTAAEADKVKCDFRIEKESNEKQKQTDGKEYNMNREKKNSKNDEDGSNKDSNHISEEKQELSNSNIVEDRQNAKHELIDSNIVEDNQNAKQELNDSNIVEDSQNTMQELNDRNIVEDIKTTDKIRDEEKSCKKEINGRMKHTTVTNNKDTNNIFKFETQEATSGPLESKEREQSNIKNVKNGEEQMENQIIEGYKTEENVSTSKKSHKELMEDKASEEELGENQGSNTEICVKEIKICKKSEVKQQISEQNKKERGKMIKDIKQYEEYDRKDNISGVSRNKSDENKTNIHKKLKGIIQTAYHISKTSKESSDKDEGSTDEREAYLKKEKETNGQSERKYYNYSQNESKIIERLITRSISKEINKSEDQLLTAQNLSDLEQKTNKTENVMRDLCVMPSM